MQTFRRRKVLLHSGGHVKELGAGADFSKSPAARGVSQRNIAERLGVDEGTIRNWLRNPRASQAELEEIAAIARVVAVCVVAVAVSHPNKWRLREREYFVSLSQTGGFPHDAATPPQSTMRHRDGATRFLSCSTKDHVSLQ
jgi:transcriptional regulator with XRE-family HTH domain